MPSKVQLKVLSGPIKGKVFEFSRHDAFLLGRGSDCHARLPKDLGVSRHHFLLEVNPPQAILRDLGSSMDPRQRSAVRRAETGRAGGRMRRRYRVRSLLESWRSNCGG